MVVYFKKYYTNKNNFLTIYFKIVHVCLGIDFGFFKYKTQKIKFAAKCLCLLPWLLFSITLWPALNIIPITPVTAIWMILLLNQYAIDVFILLFHRSDTTLFQFSRDLKFIDLKLNAPQSKCVERNISILITLDICYRFLMALYSCYLINNCVHNVWPNFVFFAVLITNDIILITNLYVFYAFYKRLQFLNSSLNTTRIKLVISSYISLYKLIADKVEKYKSAYDAIVSK